MGRIPGTPGLLALQCPLVPGLSMSSSCMTSSRSPPRVLRWHGKIIICSYFASIWFQFDPAVQRFLSMRVSTSEYFRLTPYTFVQGMLITIVPFALMYRYIKKKQVSTHLHKVYISTGFHTDAKTKWIGFVLFTSGWPGQKYLGMFGNKSNKNTSTAFQ